MANIIVVFPKIEDAKSIRNLLVRHGYQVTAVCTSGAQALNYADVSGDVMIVCGYRFTDMIYSQLRDYLPKDFPMLLLASSGILEQKEQDNIISVAMPLKVHELIDTIDMMQHNQRRLRRKRKERAKTRDPKEQKIIDKAKKILMERNHMAEEEAHRYLQKCSMDSGTNMVESAQMVISMLDAR